MAGYGVWVTEGSSDNKTSHWWMGASDQVWFTYDEFVAKHQAKFLMDKAAGAPSILFESKQFDDPTKPKKQDQSTTK